MGFSQTKGSNGVVVVQVDGQLIVGNRHELKELGKPRWTGATGACSIDFSRTGYIDSSGLGAWSRFPSRFARSAGSSGCPDSTTIFDRYLS